MLARTTQRHLSATSRPFLRLRSFSICPPTRPTHCHTPLLLRTIVTTPTTQELHRLGEMNVTRYNFKDCFDDLKRDIEEPTCQFIAIDTEFTGLSPNEDGKERFIDTLEERYQKVKRAGESFLITQFGLSTVHIDDDERFLIKTWNFYVFPRPYGQSDERFLCQASSLQFLSEHGFDFNKFIGEGIPFLSLNKTEPMKQRLEKRIENMNKPNKNLSLDDAGQAFQKEVHATLDAWIESGDARKGTNVTIPARNSFFKMIVHETVRSKATYLYSESTSDGVEVRFVSKKVKEELLAARAQAMRDELDEAVGFSNVIDVISKSKKPVVGHNALLDFVYVFNQFYKPLPDTLTEFKTQLLQLFPTIYDTKHVALRSPLGAKLSSTSLSALFEYMRDNVQPTPENLLSSDPRFDAYRGALKQETESDASLLCHEAGFDAFMTGVCFLGLLAHDANGELAADGVTSGAGNRERLTKRMAEMEMYKNRLNLMISDEAFLDLDNNDQTIDRSTVYRVSVQSNDKKRRLQHIKLEDLFAHPNKITRVIRENDRDAFVYLTESVESTTTKANELGVVVTPFDEYKAQASSQRDRARTSKTTQTVVSNETTTVAATEPPQQPLVESSVWNRCTIQ